MTRTKRIAERIRAMPIPGLPGYLATENGEIVSTLSGVERVLKPRANALAGGYGAVHVRPNGGAGSVKSVHVLVAAAFLGERPPGLVTCHCDGDKTNNRPSNLRYDTRAGNSADMAVHGTLLAGESGPGARLTEAQVRDAHASHETDAACAKRLGVGPTAIASIRNGRTWKCLGLGPYKHRRRLAKWMRALERSAK